MRGPAYAYVSYSCNDCTLNILSIIIKKQNSINHSYFRVHNLYQNCFSVGSTRTDATYKLVHFTKKSFSQKHNNIFSNVNFATCFVYK